MKKVLQRVSSWPQEAQEEALESLKAIEDEYLIDPNLSRELGQSRAQALRGQGISLTQLRKKLRL